MTAFAIEMTTQFLYTDIVMGDVPKFIDNHYEVIDILGKGFSGEVYRVRFGNQVLALKMLKPYALGMNTADLISTFKFEFNLLKDLKHPNIVTIHDFGYDVTLKRFYFTAEWLEATDLAKFAEGKSFSELEGVFLQAFSGLAYLHAQNVIHGDLKAQNLLVIQTPTGAQLKIIDFGIAHPVFAQKGGTPATMPPEKILKEHVDARSDLYSMGVIIYTLLAGKNPFLRENMSKTLTSHLSYVPAPLVVAAPHIPMVWSKVVEKLLQKNPNNRYLNAAEILRQLEREGMVQGFLVKSNTLPAHWIGRPESLDVIRDFLNDIKTNPKKHYVLELRGETGLGKTRLLTELIYQAELSGVSIAREDTAEPGGSLKIFFDQSLNKIKRKVEQCLQQGTHVAGFNFNEEKLFRLEKVTTIHHELRALSREELAEYLREVTHQTKIPRLLLNAIYHHTSGNLSLVMQVIRSLMQDPLLCEPSGRWNLSTFEEAPPTLEQLGMANIQQAFEEVQHQVDDPIQQWRLNLLHAEGLCKQRKLSESLQLLGELRMNIPFAVGHAERLQAKAHLLFVEGWVACRERQFKSARGLLCSALCLLEEAGLDQDVLGLRTINLLAFVELEEGRHAEAIGLFEKSANLAEQLPQHKQFQVVNNDLGNAYKTSGQAQKAIPRLLEEANFYELIDKNNAIKAYYNLGECHLMLNQFEQAKQYYLICANKAREQRSWEYLLMAYNGLGNVATFLKDGNDALEYYGRAETLAEYLKDYLSAATTAQNHGVILVENHRYDEALEDIQRSLTYLKKIPTPTPHAIYLKVRASLEIGDIFRLKKDHHRSMSKLVEAMNQTHEHSICQGLVFYILESMAKLHLDLNHPEEFIKIYPELLKEAQNEEQRIRLQHLVQRSPIDPSDESGQTIIKKEEAKVMEESFANTQQVNALQALLSINRRLLTEENLGVLAGRILEFSLELSGAESALIATLQDDQQLEILSTLNLPMNEATKSMSQGIAKKVLTTGNSVTAHDAIADQEFNVHESVMNLGLRSILCVPIRVKGKPIGILYLSHTHRKALFSYEIVNLMEAFADQIALGIINAQRISELKQLKGDLETALQHANLEIADLKQTLRDGVQLMHGKLVGQSYKLQEMAGLIYRMQDSTVPVLIAGETGVGKELVARFIHESSNRKNAAFVAINCGAIPENLLESELFGYKIGAFTGATKDKKGLLQEAHGGTLFLDEIAELPLNMQVKLLRVLQEGEVTPLGAQQPVPVDIRIVAASHQSLTALIQEKKFREDLYYRLAGMQIEVPTLRERKEDIPLLVEHFLQKMKTEQKLEKDYKMSKELLAALVEYDWPGNVRELENFLRTAVVFADRGLLHLDHLPAYLKKKLQPIDVTVLVQNQLAAKQVQISNQKNTEGWFEKNYHDSWQWQQYEKAIFVSLLKKYQFNVMKVADVLKVGVATVYLKMRRFNIKENVQDPGLVYPEDMSLDHFKAWLTKKVFEQNGEKPYITAKKLGLNPVTVYKYLKQ